MRAVWSAKGSGLPVLQRLCQGNCKGAVRSLNPKPKPKPLILQVMADASAVVYAGPFAGHGWGMGKGRVSSPNEEPGANGAPAARGALQALYPGGGPIPLHARKAAGGYAALPPPGAGVEGGAGGAGAPGAPSADWVRSNGQEPADDEELELQPLRLHVVGVMGEHEGSSPSALSAHWQADAADEGHALRPAGPVETLGAEGAAAAGGTGAAPAAAHGGARALHSPFNEAEHQHWRGGGGANAPVISSAAWVRNSAADAVQKREPAGLRHTCKLQGAQECLVAVRARSNYLRACALRPLPEEPEAYSLPLLLLMQGSHSILVCEAGAWAGWRGDPRCAHGSACGQQRRAAPVHRQRARRACGRGGGGGDGPAHAAANARAGAEGAGGEAGARQVEQLPEPAHHLRVLRPGHRVRRMPLGFVGRSGAHLVGGKA